MLSTTEDASPDIGYWVFNLPPCPDSNLRPKEIAQSKAQLANRLYMPCSRATSLLAFPDGVHPTIRCLAWVMTRLGIDPGRNISDVRPLRPGSGLSTELFSDGGKISAGCCCGPFTNDAANA